MSVKTILENIIDINNAKEVVTNDFNDTYYYVGPNAIDKKNLESDIIRVLPHYTKHMDSDELDELIELCSQLKFDYIKIHLYEQQEKFERCMDIYLYSPRCKKDEIFRWLHYLNTRKNTKKSNCIDNLKEKILAEIENLVLIDPEKTGYVIDEWLPEKQREVIDKLQRKPELQLQYLESYLKEREEDIKDSQHASARNFKFTSQTKDYKTLLELHVNLLAKNSNPRLIEVVRKDYYPVDWLDKIKENSSLLIKEAQAHLKKRAEMFVESLKLFLELLKQVDGNTIDMEYYSTKIDDGKVHKLSFNKLYIEIIDILVRNSSRPDSSDTVWFDTLRTLFKIKDNLEKNSGTKASIIKDIIFPRITEMMSLMSDYVDFEKVVDLLLEIDSNATYEHCNKWFEGLYLSKNDQELLLTSAKRLLSNENSSLIDIIIQRNNIGFIGDREKQKCSICDQELGGLVNDGAFILTT